MRLSFPDCIKAFQITVTLQPGMGCGLNDTFDVEKEVIAGAIDAPEEIEENREMIVQACLEGLPFRSIHFFRKGLVKAGKEAGKSEAAFA